MYLRRLGWWRYDTITYVVVVLAVSDVTTGRCPEGKWGGKCEFDCHCQVERNCRADDGKCASDLCDFGWSARNCSVPSIDKFDPACKQGTYGVNCLQLCHCMPSVRCHRVNGVCAGNCHPDWGGPSCSFNLPRLNQRPSVKQEGCGILTITWPEWDKENVVTSSGAGPIRFYNLMNNLNGTWSRFLSVFHVNGSINHSVVTTLKIGTVATFRVDVNRLKAARSNDQKVYMGPPGVPTSSINVFCTESHPKVTPFSSVHTSESHPQVTPFSSDRPSGSTKKSKGASTSGSKSRHTLLIVVGSVIPAGILLCIALTFLFARLQRRKSNSRLDIDNQSTAIERHASMMSQINEKSQFSKKSSLQPGDVPLSHSPDASLQQLSKSSAYSSRVDSVYSAQQPKIDLNVTVISKKKDRRRSKVSGGDDAILSSRSRQDSSVYNDGTTLAVVESPGRRKRRKR